jgi:diguanylate cyclase (GGDEF)-like protein
VVRLDQLRGPLLAGLLWSAFALASVFVRDTGGAVLLLWLPSAVAVAALYATPTQRWPALVAALFAAQVLSYSLLGIGLASAIGFAVANQAEALICAVLGIRVLGGRANGPRTFRHVVGLFAAAVLGCTAGALLALPFRSDPNLLDLAWWFLSSVLAVLTATPVLLYQRRRLGFGEEDVRSQPTDPKPGFFLTVVAMLALGATVISSPFPWLLPLLFVAVVFAVIRFGQLAGACGVIAFAVAGMLASLGGRSPAPFLELEPFAAGLLFQAQMLLMLATALPIAAMFMARDALEGGLRNRNEELRANLTILNLTKTLAGIGRWQYDLVTGKQDWSEQMLVLNGLPPELAPDPGDIRDLLPDGGEALFSQLAQFRDSRIPYSFDYSVQPPDGSERILKMNVFNEFDSEGRRVALFAVAMDVTEQVQREHALKRAREHAFEKAAEAQKLANTDQLTGLANRRATLGWLKSMLGASGEVDEPLALLMFDIDHFKLVNDNHGHQAGDEVLRNVAAITRAQIRAEDLVGRIGGEEFVCILSGLSDEMTRGLADRLCGAIAGKTGGDGLPPVTISVGLASYRQGDTTETLFARADAALYEAKQGGRNQVRRAA